MKKIILIVLGALMLCSCAKENLSVILPSPEQGAQVHLTFGSTDSFTRAVFDNTSAAEPWEKEINNLVVFTYDSNGKQVMFKYFNEQDIASLSANFVVPSPTAGQTLRFYAIANMPSLGAEITEQALLDYDAGQLSRYNSFFGFVSTGTLREYGFAMSGKATATINSDGTVTNVSITLKRVVAKIAVKISIDPTFNERHHGSSITIQDIYITSKASRSKLFFNDYSYRHSNANEFFIHRHANGDIDGDSYAIFYLYEQGPPTYGPDEKVVLTICTKYNQSGYIYGTGDAILNEFNIELDGSGGGEIKRNGYYRIEGTITDFDALHTRSAITASEWEVPTTIDIGNITITEQ